MHSAPENMKCSTSEEYSCVISRVCVSVALWIFLPPHPPFSPYSHFMIQHIWHCTISASPRCPSCSTVWSNSTSTSTSWNGILRCTGTVDCGKDVSNDICAEKRNYFFVVYSSVKVSRCAHIGRRISAETRSPLCISTFLQALKWTEGLKKIIMQTGETSLMSLLLWYSMTHWRETIEGKITTDTVIFEWLPWDKDFIRLNIVLLNSSWL